MWKYAAIAIVKWLETDALDGEMKRARNEYICACVLSTVAEGGEVWPGWEGECDWSPSERPYGEESRDTLNFISADTDL